MERSKVDDDALCRHVLIVGAGPGIGSNFARIASESGAALTLVARAQKTLDEVREGLTPYSRGAPVRTLVADAADPEDLAGVLGAYAGHTNPPVDTALFNVSTWVPGGLDSDLAEVSRGLQAGAVSALAMAQALVPTMREVSAARLLFTGSGAADSPSAASLGLGMQKAAMRNLAIGLSKELADTQVAVRTLTVHGTLAPGTPLDPARVAEALWALVREPGGEVEVAFRG